MVFRVISLHSTLLLGRKIHCKLLWHIPLVKGIGGISWLEQNLHEAVQCTFEYPVTVTKYRGGLDLPSYIFVCSLEASSGIQLVSVDKKYNLLHESLV